jgi:hypothetical protein
MQRFAFAMRSLKTRGAWPLRPLKTAPPLAAESKIVLFQQIFVHISAL